MIRIEVKADDLAALARSIRNEVDGKKLVRGLTADIRKALRPAVDEAKSSIMSMSSLGIPAEGEPLRSAIARQVKAEVRASGQKAGARVKARKRGMPRGFANAPKRTNRVAGWRHPVYGSADNWAHQIGKPNWFDDAMRRHHRGVRDAVVHAMAESARRITRKV